MPAWRCRTKRCGAWPPATDDDTLAAWVSGRPILVFGLLGEVPIDQECVALQGLPPKVCGVLGDFGFSAKGFWRPHQGFRALERRQPAGSLRDVAPLTAS